VALTVTPGGASDDALGTLAAFKAYHDARGNDYSAYSDTAIEQSIRRGTVWVEGLGARTKGRVGSRWPGARASATQRREWPRSGALRVDGTAIASSTIPAEVEEAVFEAAFYDLGNSGLLHATVTPAEIATSEAVGPIKVSYATAEQHHAARVMLTVVDDLLSSILIPEPKGPFLYMQGIGPK